MKLEELTTLIITISLTGTFSVLASSGFWAYFTSKKHKYQNKNDLLMGLAYTGLVQICRKHIKEGFIAPEEYHDIYTYMYLPYKNRGGNGHAQKLMYSLSLLPDEDGNHFDKGDMAI